MLAWVTKEENKITYAGKYGTIMYKKLWMTLGKVKTGNFIQTESMQQDQWPYSHLCCDVLVAFRHIKCPYTL